MKLRSIIKPPGLQELPADVYALQVEALYSDESSLAVGVVAAFLTTASTGLLIHDAVIVGLSVALAALGLVRLHFMRLFWVRRPALDAVAMRRWEKGYVLGGALHLALLGAFCLAAFARSDDAFARLAAVSITLAYLIGTPGRSFASNLLVDVQILVSIVPLAGSLLIAGPRYWIIVLFVILPFLLALKKISTRLRGIFRSAVLQARDLGILAGRFDTALTNMPHGLAMFEADGRVSVANERLGVLLGAPEPSLQDRFIAEVLHKFEENCVTRQTRTEEMSGRADVRSERWVSTRADGRSISFTVQGMADGGGVVIAEDVTEQVRAEASLAFLARYDKLTGLPNRHGFQELLSRRLDDDPQSQSVLMFIDLDRFKSVNDTLGHAMGDRLLRLVAERLRASAHPETLLARFGGDEFVLHQHVSDMRLHGARLAARIIKQLSEPFDVDGHAIVIGASIGIAEAKVPVADIDALLRDADLALYRVKAEQKGTFRFFESEMQTAAIARRDIESDMRTAIARGQMSLHFQPMLDVAQGRVTTCEALLRWRHPTRGHISPAEFVAIAEETGYIWELGSWVLRQACQACARWPSPIAVAVNVSALQFQRGDLADVALSAVMGAGLSPSRLEIEITETALLQDLGEARATLLKLRHFGFRLALDDFGTGYSSLSYLQRLPFDKVKLDRSFLLASDGGDRGSKVLQGVTRLCRDLGMSVVMEGVETQEQFDLVAGQVGVHEVQGFFLSRPQPQDVITARLQAGFPSGFALGGIDANALYG